MACFYCLRGIVYAQVEAYTQFKDLTSPLEAQIESFPTSLSSHYPYPSICAFSDTRGRVKKDRNYQNHTKNVPQRSFEVKLFPKIWCQCTVFTSHSVIPVSYEKKLKQSTSVF